MKYILIISILLNITLSVNGQICNKADLTYTYIKESLVSDIYFFLDFKKEEIPEAYIFYDKERIEINFERFNIDTGFLITNKTDPQDFSEIGCLKDSSNYVLFHSGFENNIIMFDILFNRADFFNVPGKTVYETWKRNNAGISYLFIFNSDGCLIELKKMPISFD